MSDGGNIIEVARNVGVIASLVGSLGTAVKVGQWKGKYETRFEQLEKKVDETISRLSKVDDRVDGIERQLLETMTSLKKDVEYIRGYIDEQKHRRRKEDA